MLIFCYSNLLLPRIFSICLGYKFNILFSYLYIRYRIQYLKCSKLYLRFLQNRITVLLKWTRSNCFVHFVKNNNIYDSFWLGLLGIQKKKYRMLDASFSLFGKEILLRLRKFQSLNHFKRLRVALIGYKRFIKSTFFFINSFFFESTFTFNSFKSKRIKWILKRFYIMKYCVRFNKPYIFTFKQRRQEILLYRSFIKSFLNRVILSRIDYYSNLSFGFSRTIDPRMFRYY